MTRTPSPLTDGCLILDNSGTALIKTCSKMAYYKHLLRRERSGSAVARDVGKAFHSALEARYKGAGSDKPSPDVAQLMQDRLTIGYDGLVLAEDDYLTLARMQQVLRFYNDGCRYEMGKGSVYDFPGYGQEPFDVLAVELPFAVQLGVIDTPAGEVPVIYIGRSDLLVRWCERGEVTIMDHKTSKRWDTSTITTWQTAAGPKGYAACIPQWIAEGIDSLPETVRRAMEPYESVRLALAEAGVQRVDGFCLNAICIRKTEQLTRAKNPPTEFHRHLVYYDSHVLDEWRSDTLCWAETWLHQCDSGCFPMNDKHCAHFYGRACPYLEVCSMPPEQRDAMLGTDLFMDVTWNPLDRTTDTTGDA